MSLRFKKITEVISLKRFWLPMGEPHSQRYCITVARKFQQKVQGNSGIMPQKEKLFLSVATKAAALYIFQTQSAQIPADQPIYTAKIHMGIINPLHFIVESLGLCQGGKGLLRQG